MFVLFLLALATGPWLFLGCAHEQSGHPKPRQPLTSRQIYARAAPGTAQIVEKGVKDPAGGSGVIYDKAQRLVVTNAHVVQGLAAIEVRFNDNTKSPAKVLGRDPCEDLAVVQTESMPATVAELPFGDSAVLKPADPVDTLGYPESLQDYSAAPLAFTSGPVQSVGVRADVDPSLPVYVDTIQHSATINPGNSGGPLLNEFGEVVGINTLSNSGSDDDLVQGQFYAISANHAKPLLTYLSSGHDKNYLGADLVPLSAVDTRDYYEDGQADRAQKYIDDHHLQGLVVEGDPEQGSALYKSKYVEGDLLTALSGDKLTRFSDLCGVLDRSAPGKVVRTDGAYVLYTPPEAKLGETWTDELRLP